MSRTKEEVIEEFRIGTIKEAAVRVIGRKGLSGASMQEIAEEAGIAKGTIYLYFKNQQELLEAAVDHALSALLERLEGALEGSGTFSERLGSLIRGHIEFFDEQKDLFQVHMASTPGGSDPSATRCDRSSRPQYKHYIEKLTKFLEQAARAGEIRCEHPRRLALFFEEGMVAVIFERMSEKKRMPVEKEVQWLLATVVGGVARKRGRA